MTSVIGVVKCVVCSFGLLDTIQKRACPICGTLHYKKNGITVWEGSKIQKVRS